MTTRLALTVALTAFVLGAPSTPAAAQVTDTVIGSCVFSGGGAHCVRQYRYGAERKQREPSAEEIAESRERERRWVARCRPALRQDAYGVNRYVYAAPGCEFGRDQD